MKLGSIIFIEEEKVRTYVPYSPYFLNVQCTRRRRAQSSRVSIDVRDADMISFNLIYVVNHFRLKKRAMMKSSRAVYKEVSLFCPVLHFLPVFPFFLP
jgi:hypothetical protein